MLSERGERWWAAYRALQAVCDMPHPPFLHLRPDPRAPAPPLKSAFTATGHTRIAPSLDTIHGHLGCGAR
jgi:hypothetical protein